MSLLPKQKILAVLNHSRLELRGVQFSDEMIDRFQAFCSILQKWNEKINLTSEKDALSILEKHVFDSLQYLRWLDPSHKTLDIGSGAGFPGIPIKIIHPGLDLTLMESQRKRCSFLHGAIRALKLEGVEVAEGRAESFSNQEAFSGKFDRVFFRGFSSLDTCLAVGLPFLKVNGMIILKKSPEEMPGSADGTFKNARIMESKEVEGFEGQSSLMMVIEKCST
jgi:16S rRNA (guanine527-N7)-methyltransferase